MSNYRPFNQLRTNELVATRHGWLDARYELSDGQFTYGSLSYQFIRRRKATVETADGTWVFSKRLFCRVITITKPDGEIVGKVSQNYFGRTNELVLTNGFNAEFTRTGIFPTEFNWVNSKNGDILRAVHRHFHFHRPVNITLNPTVKIPETPLLALLSIFILVLRQRRKAAAH